MKLLIVEDEKSLSDSMVTYLKEESYICETASNFATALDKSESYDYDCILLDIMLPGGSGFQILKELKANKKADGVLIVSAKDSLDDRVTGLKLGADDYISKPFHLSELGARIAAVIRRRNFEGNNLVKFNEISIDTQTRSVNIHHTPLELTKKEYQLLLYFTTNKRKVIPKNAIADHLWGDDLEGNNDFIYTHIKNLRKKLVDTGSADYIKSVYGMGYKFSD